MHVAVFLTTKCTSWSLPGCDASFQRQMVPHDTDDRTCRESRPVPFDVRVWQLAHVLRSADLNERGQLVAPPIIRCTSPTLPPPPPTPPHRPPLLPLARRPLGSSRDAEMNILRNELAAAEARAAAAEQQLANKQLCIENLKEINENCVRVVSGLVRQSRIE